MLVVNECAMDGVLRFIPRMTEHDVLVTGIIKIMHRLLAVAARLLALVESLALRHRDVHTVRRVIRLNPSRNVVSTPLALIHANDPVLVPSGPNPLADVTVVVRHLLLGITVCLQDLFFVAIISVASPSWPDLTATLPCHSLFRAATPPPRGVLLAASPPHGTVVQLEACRSKSDSCHRVPP